MTQQQFRDFIAQETQKYAQIVESAHITPE